MPVWRNGALAVMLVAPAVPGCAVVCGGVMLAAPVWAEAARPQGLRRPVIAGSVRVRDSSQTQPVLVQLHSEHGGMVSRVTTSSSGRFEFFDVSQGQYDLVINANGFKPVRMRVEYSYAPLDGILIFLEPEPPAGAPPAPGDAVSVRLLAAPAKAREEYQKGLESIASNKLDDAVARFRKAIELHPGFDDAYVQIGRILLQQNDPSGAQQALDNATRLNPQNDLAFTLLGRAFRQRKLLAEAVAALQTAVKLKEDSWFARLELGEALLGLGRLDEAFPHVARAHQLNTKEPAIHQLYYNVLIRKNQHREALAELYEFLKMFPDHQLAPRARQQREALQKFLTGSGKE
ncbi:MAG: tetratricopeptide repeat protein [Candidatus Acidiferrales bacterium]